MKPPRIAEEEPGPPNAALDPYRRGVVRAFESDIEVGYLWSRVVVWWTVAGPFWRRRHIDPREQMEWFLEFDESPADDGLPFDSLHFADPHDAYLP